MTPGRYVGAAAVDGGDEPFNGKIARLTMALRGQMAESTRLDAQIEKQLARLGL